VSDAADRAVGAEGGEPVGGPPRMSVTTLIWAVVSTVLALLLLALATFWFRQRWREVIGLGPLPAIGWPWVGLGALLLVAHAATSVRLWMQVVRATGARFTTSEAADTFMPSLLARYVPGKVWANGARMVLARRAGVTLGSATGAMLWEMAIVLFTGGIFALALLAGSADRRDLLLALILCVVAAGVLATLSVLAAAARRAHSTTLARWLRGAEVVRSPLQLAPAFGTALVGWILYGAAHVAIILALGDVPPAAWPLVGGAVAIAWAGGFIAIVAPAGLGVRDGLLLVMIGAVLDPVRALLFVAISRLAQFAVDLLLTAGWLGLRLTRRR
jgi:glycosyltransferase 2 family protein